LSDRATSMGSIIIRRALVLVLADKFEGANLFFADS
jgi:hypothetical protein